MQTSSVSLTSKRLFLLCLQFTAPLPLLLLLIHAALTLSLHFYFFYSLHTKIILLFSTWKHSKNCIWISFIKTDSFFSILLRIHSFNYQQCLSGFITFLLLFHNLPTTSPLFRGIAKRNFYIYFLCFSLLQLHVTGLLILCSLWTWILWWKYYLRTCLE